MATINNPRFSRPIDVHRWSEHPEVKGMVDVIWQDYLPVELTEKEDKRGPGPRPKTSYKKQLRVLILDLYVAWKEHPELSIGISMSSNEWKANSRYNALHLSKKLITITNALCDVGLIDLALGSYGGPGAKTNRTTRIRAAGELQDLFQKAQFSREDVKVLEEQEVIILRDIKEDGKAGKEVEYEDSNFTNSIRKDLQAYNKLLQASFIDIATLETPLIHRDDADKSEVPVRVHRDQAWLRRVFSRKNWSMNGRFYGGWWQQINSAWRSRIFIDDQPTIEVDFKGLHVAMLYAQSGSEMMHDPYDVSVEDLMPIPPQILRTLIKRLALTAINAREKPSAYKAFRDGFPKGHMGKSLSDKALDQLLSAFLKVNPLLEEFLFSDQGIQLMYQDSLISNKVHRHFTSIGVPVLSVHDSYIIDHMRIDELRAVMADASKSVVGISLPTALSLPDLPEYQDVSDQQLQDHIENRKGIRCRGYMERLFTFQEQTGRDISPVARGDAEMDHWMAEQD